MSDSDSACELCGHEPACGNASAAGHRLCHTDDHSCYHAWTVWDARPTDIPGIARVGNLFIPTDDQAP